MNPIKRQSATYCSAILFASLILSTSAEASSSAHALIVGFNESIDPDTPPLRYADDDAVNYANFFSELGVTVHLLTELDEATAALHPGTQIHDRPTKTALAAHMKSIADDLRNADDDASLYVVYAGHGSIQNGQGVITLADGYLTRQEFITLLNSSPAQRNHVIIDACKSYYLVFSRDGSDERRPYDQSFHSEADLLSHPKTGFILSTSSGQNSHEWEQFQAGVFSHEVRSAVRGGADHNQDGRITYQELAGFVFAANRSIRNEKYRPRFLVVPPVNDDTLVEIGHASRRWLILSSATPSHSYVENSDGIRLVDLHSGTFETRVLLPSRGRLFLRDVSRQTEYVLPSRARFHQRSLQKRDLRVAYRGAEHEAFRQLFVTPFDALAMQDSKHTILDRSLDVSTTATLSKPTSRLRRWAYATMSASVATALAGYGFRIAASNRLDAYRDANGDQQRQIAPRIRRLDRSAAGAWATAGALGVVSAILWGADLLSPSEYP